MKTFTAGLLGALVGTILTNFLWLSSPAAHAAPAQEKAAALRAPKFELIDKDGNVRGVWECDAREHASLNLFPKGKSGGLTLGISPEGDTGLWMTPPHKAPPQIPAHAVVHMKNDGQGSIHIWDKARKSLLDLGEK